MTFSTTGVLIGALLLLIQLVAALPWLALAFVRREDWVGVFRGGAGVLRSRLARRLLIRGAVVLGVLIVGPLLFQSAVQEKTALEVCGHIYAAVLQTQLVVDFFIAAFALMLWLWPKGGAVALAAFREGVRQSLFWLLTGLGFVLLTASPLVPYFTFGEDHLVVKDIGYDTLMLFAVVFGALAASMSVSEEIEGRTAVTLMSKPVSRRQFLLGKFAGIVLAALVMFALLGTYFEGILLFKHWWDRMDPIPVPEWVAGTLARWDLPSDVTDFLRGAGMWTSHSLDAAPGLVLGFSQVMVLVAIAVSLATRVPMVVNLATVVVVYILANLAPVLVDIGRNAQATNPGSTVAQLLAFVAQLFDTLLPNLNSFRIDPAILGDVPPPPLPFAEYIASVGLYGVLYTGIVLLFGLILFEDRDLA
jgi:hypothetical protein